MATAVLGELETGAFLLPLDDAERLWSAAAGWAGDRFVVYATPDGPPALVWRLRFENDGEAQEFFQAAVDASRAADRGPCEVRERSTDEASRHTAWCEVGRDWFEVDHSDVVVLRSLPDEGATRPIADLVFAAPALDRPGEPLPGLLRRWRAIFDSTSTEAPHPRSESKEDVDRGNRRQRDYRK